MIRSWALLTEAEQASALSEIQNIFFLTSSVRSFSSPFAKSEFWNKWTEYYFKNEPENFLLHFTEGRVSGYLSGCRDSKSAHSQLISHNASLALFEDLFSYYPSHFHINLHPQYQGQGIGGKLVENFVESLKGKSRGVHVVTSPTARNRAFYRRNGFTEEIARPWRDVELLFMGRSLG